jgi:hypothetical protein
MDYHGQRSVHYSKDCDKLARGMPGAAGEFLALGRPVYCRALADQRCPPPTPELPP